MNPSDRRAGPGSTDSPDPNAWSSDFRSEPDPIPSHALLRGHGSVTILHQGSAYTLRNTRTGKLLLTK